MLINSVLQRLHFLQAAPGAQRDAGQRIVGDGDRQAGRIAQHLIQIGRAASRRRSARCPCRRCRRPVPAACASSATFTASTIAPTGSARLSAIWRWVMVISFGTPFIRSRPLISMVTPSPSSGRQAEPISFLMRSAVRFADQQVMVAADIGDDRLVHLVAADAHRARIDDAAERQHRHFGGAAADIDDHRAGGLGDRQAGADRRRHRLLDQEDAAGAGRHRPIPGSRGARPRSSPRARRR